MVWIRLCELRQEKGDKGPVDHQVQSPVVRNQFRGLFGDTHGARAYRQSSVKSSLDSTFHVGPGVLPSY